MNWDIQERDIRNVDIDPLQVKSGDTFLVNMLYGGGSLTMYGTGSRTDHCTMALWFDDGLYIVESVNPVVRRTPFLEYVDICRRANQSLIWLPLKDEVAENFDVQASIDFFNETEGNAYGYYNFIYGWLDTPFDNNPPFLPDFGIEVVASVLDQIIPKAMEITVIEGLNKRMGTEGLGLSEIAALAATQGMSVEDVMAIPEQDGWIYSGMPTGPAPSYVCSSYVTAHFKEAGLFGDLDI